MKILSLLLFFTVAICSVAQAQDLKNNLKDPSSIETITPDPVADRAAKLEEQQNFVLEKINSKLEAFEENFETLQEELSKADWSSAMVGFLGVLVGAVLSVFATIWVQKNQTTFQINKSLVDWKLQQISELYGPLHALLRQSNALYRQMNKALSEHDKERFRLTPKNNESNFDNALFEIKIDGEWKVFRTVTHLNLVYGEGLGVEQYFDEIIEIGERVVSVIQKNAGFVREDQAELADVFGSYLAHFVILRLKYSSIKGVKIDTPSTSQNEMFIDDSAAFPFQIQGLIKIGYERLNTELKHWNGQGNLVRLPVAKN